MKASDVIDIDTSSPEPQTRYNPRHTNPTRRKGKASSSTATNNAHRRTPHPHPRTPGAVDHASVIELTDSDDSDDHWFSNASLSSMSRKNDTGGSNYTLRARAGPSTSQQNIPQAGLRPPNQNRLNQGGVKGKGKERAQPLFLPSDEENAPPLPVPAPVPAPPPQRPAAAPAPMPFAEDADMYNPWDDFFELDEPLNRGRGAPEPAAPLHRSWSDDEGDDAPRNRGKGEDGAFADPFEGNPSGEGDDGRNGDGAPTAVDPVSTTVASVLEIIPDVEPDHLLGLVQQHLPTNGPIQILEHVLHVLFEDPTYPKVPKGKNKGKGKRKADDEDGDGKDREGGPELKGADAMKEKDSAANEEKREPKKAKIDYGSTDRLYAGGRDYTDLALNELQVAFPHIPKPYLRRQLAVHRGLYAPTYMFVHEQENRLKLQANDDAEGDPRQPYVRKLSLYVPPKKGKGRALEDAEFEEEKKWVVEKLAGPQNPTEGEGEGGPADQAVGEDNMEEEEELEDDGTFIECQCCFSSYPFEKMIQCPEAHLFCRSCMLSYASTKLGGHDHNITCMHQSGCPLLFPLSELQRFLPDKMLMLYERLKQQKEIKAAGLEQLEECPFCDWACVMEMSTDEEKLFRCGNEDGCGTVSCRMCKKEDHLPRSCKEVEDDKHLDGRHAIEEAMTRALMRNCPKCQKAFIKEQGCNKMTCPNCSTLSCYVCRQVVTGYDHFNQAPHGAASSSANAKKCLLWEPVEQRHAEEVKAAREEAMAKYKKDHPDVEDVAIKVDLPPPPPAPANPYNHYGMLAQPIPPHLDPQPLRAQLAVLRNAQANAVGRLQQETRGLERAVQREAEARRVHAATSNAQHAVRHAALDRAAATVRLQGAQEGVVAHREQVELLERQVQARADALELWRGREGERGAAIMQERLAQERVQQERMQRLVDYARERGERDERLRLARVDGVMANPNQRVQTRAAAAAALAQKQAQAPKRRGRKK